ncbi:MAG TPA: hypothetical protein VEJ00_00205 [Candidatus Acidoferrales bacterium]|nr:hypothetical protein [Candidatus Acidoferrales bacterium]
MDRIAANTLRTLGIVLISAFVIGASLILLLLALCLGAMSNGGGSSSDSQMFLACILIIALLIVLGVFSIARLAKGIVRGEPEYPAPLTIFPKPATTVAVPSPAFPPSPGPPAAAAPRTIDVAAHFSPASRAAIHQVVLAISTKLAVETLIVLIGWTHVYGRPAPFPVYRYSFLAWGLAAAAPLIVLIYALLRHPGPRAFAYSLVIPALHIFFGTFGHSATIFILFRANPAIPPVISLFALLPWLLDFLILYLAWKAIRLTGIQPSPTRLIVATVVIFFYTSVLPIFVVIMNQFWRLAR